jgi:hypothetical protein
MPEKPTSVDFPGIGTMEHWPLEPGKPYLFTEELKDALRKEGLPVRDTWHGVDGSFAEGKPIYIADDTAERLESRRLCMICAILLGSILLMAILGAAVFADSFEITKRLTALLYGEVV